MGYDIIYCLRGVLVAVIPNFTLLIELSKISTIGDGAGGRGGLISFMV